MKEIKNIILCGCGAIGSIYADIFSKIPEVNFRVLVDEERLNRYSSNPILFNGNKLDLNYILPDDMNFKADLIIIATKMSGFESALTEIKNFVSDDTVILSLLNGVNSEQLIASKYGRQHVLYSYFIGHSSVRSGNSVKHDGVNTIVFGSACSDDELNVEIVKNLFDKYNINYEIPDDIIHSLWTKFMLNVSTNTTTALFRVNFGQMLSNPLHMDLVIKIMREVQLIAEAEGVNHPETLIDEALIGLNKMTPEGRTSMLQDVEAGRKTENEIFASTIVELGKKHNIHTPYCLILDAMFKVIDYNSAK